MAQIISIPQRRYEYLKKIITAYALQGEKVTNEILAKEYKLKRLSISVSNPFLIDMGIIEPISKSTFARKKITEIGLKLGRALHNYPVDVPKLWRIVINGKPSVFFHSLFKEIYEKKLSTKKEIRAAIYTVAQVIPGILKNNDYNIGTTAIIEILKDAGYLKLIPPNKYQLNEEFIDEIRYYISTIDENEKGSNSHRVKKYPRKVFIIHGHDNEMKNTVARFLEGIGVDAVILHERADESSTIIQKVLDYSNKIGYAIALLSPDDIGYSTNDGPRSKHPRPRQNVILELGIFLGKHGKEKVILLVKEREKLEFPSDYNGVLVKDYHSNSDNWKNELIKELKNWKFNIDANKMYQIKE